MSRQRKFDLRFKAGLSFSITIAKSFGDQQGLKQTKFHQGKNKQVRTVKVIPKEVDGEPVKPVTVDDIDEVIGWTDVESSYEYIAEDGEKVLLPMDKKALESMFSKSEYMTAIGFTATSNIKPRMYSGNHYFVTPQVDRKERRAKPSDVKAYSLIHAVLSVGDTVLLVKFVSGDREKFAVISADGDVLMMSLLIHSNYQRDAPVVDLSSVAAPQIEKMKKLFSVRRFNPGDYVDRYEEQVQAYIDDLKEEERTGKKRVKARPRVAPVQDADDFLSILDSM